MEGRRLGVKLSAGLVTKGECWCRRWSICEIWGVVRMEWRRSVGCEGEGREGSVQLLLLFGGMI